jgi:hypothetical protein
MSFKHTLSYAWNSPHVSGTLGAIFNWGFVLAGMLDSNKPPEKISTNMTSGKI